MRCRWSFLVGAGIWIALSTTLFADGVIRDGLGARSIGRGGTNIAHHDNGEVLLDNPAGMVNVEGTGLAEAGVDLLITDLHFADPFNSVDAHDNPFPLGQFSLIRKTMDEQWAYGVGFFVPAGFGATYDMQGPFPFLGPQRYKSLGALAKVLPGVAGRINDRLSVGATFGVAINHMELEGPCTLQSPGALQGIPTLIDVQNTGASPCWSLGFQYALTEATTIGLTYQSETQFRLDGRTRVVLPNPLLGTVTYDSRLDITWPQSLGLGIRHEFCPHRVLSADVIWYDWSGAFDTYDLHLTHPNSPFVPPLVEHFPLHWRDTASLRLGYERLFDSGQAVRFGYVYHPNPIPDGTLTPWIQATVEHSVSVGYGRTLGSWNLDLAYMFCFGSDQHVGTSDFIGGDFDQADYRTSGHFIALSLMRQF